MVFALLILFALSALLVLLKNVWKDKKTKEGNAFAQRFNFKQLLIGLLVLVLLLAVSGCGKQTATVDSQAPKEFDIKLYQNNDFLITAQQLKGC